MRFILGLARSPSSVTARNRIPSQIGSGGYAEPERPIPVVLAADEEMMAENGSAAQEKITPPPPAYGLWRSSVVSIPFTSVVQGHCFTNLACPTENKPRSTPLATCKWLVCLCP